jgi:hypothetical protein
MNKIFIYSFVYFLSLFVYTFADTHSIYCAPQLQPILKTIQKLPEAKELIENILKEGPIQIQSSQAQLSEQFGAFWDGENRIIYVNASPRTSTGSLIGSILFELHNARINSKISYYDELAAKGKIDRKAYVKAIEHLEYQNSLKASSIAQKGIEKGLFPKEARLITYRDFNEHFRMQQIGGHSAWIAKNFDSLAPRKKQGLEKIPFKQPKLKLNHGSSLLKRKY